MPLIFESRPIYTTFQVNTPTFSPSPGTYSSAQSVSILDAVATASIYYTSDGTLPSYPPAGTTQLYTGPLSLNSTQTLNALAVAPNYQPSVIGSATYTFQAQSPTFSPIAGSYGSAQSVTLSSPTVGASLYYTTDGSTPTYPITGTTQAYSGAITVSSSATVRAIAVLAGYLTSSVSSATYTISSGLVFSGATLPAATQYAAYSKSLASYVTGGTAPYFFSYISGGVNQGYGVSGQSLTVTPNIPISETLLLQVIDSTTPTPNSTTATFTLPINYVVPAGAQALGYTQLRWILLNPNLTQVNPGPYASTVQNYLYNGYWGYSGTSFSNIANYSMVNGVLQLAYNNTGTGGETFMGTQNTNGSGPPAAGNLAWLANAAGWYIDFGIDYTSWTTDTFGAVWLQSTEFNNAGTSGVINPAQPSYLKQYLEIDVWESGSLGPATGYQGAIVYHNGVTGTQSGSNYTIPHFTNPTQTVPHVYGASWNPNGTATFYIDNVTTGNYSILAASNGGLGGQCNATSLAWLNTQHMSVLWDCGSHGAQTPFAMNMYYVSAWGPPTTNSNLEIPFPTTQYGSVGQEMLYTLTAIAAKSGITVTTPITWSVTGGGAIDSTGTWTFTPSTAGTYTIVVTAVDSSTPTANSGQTTLTCIVS